MSCDLKSQECDYRAPKITASLLTCAFFLPCRSGMVLRITESAADSSREGSDSGPQPPPQSSPQSARVGAAADKWYVQGTLLEVRRDKLVVAFDEVDWWPLDDPGESYQCVAFSPFSLFMPIARVFFLG